jgi:hypothetical protein
VELVKGVVGDGAADARGDGLARVADKVGHSEDLLRHLGVHLELPVVRQLEDKRAWSAVSTMTMSVMKSGPSWRAMALITDGRFGLSPDKDSSVKCSSGPSCTRSGPKTMRGFFNL